MRCRNLERLAGGRKLYLKAEMFQTSGAFKMRGALNAVLSLPAVEADAGVVTHSSGNHGAALAKAAAVRGVRATVVMPEGTPAVKVSAARSYGAEIITCPRAGGMAAREAAAARVVAESGATLIPPYDHPAVMAGQGTVALELLSAVPQLDAIVVPISGGGLVSGIAVAAKALTKGRIKIIAAEPAGKDGKCADAAACKAAGDLSVSSSMPAPETIADGLRGKLGAFTWPVVRDLVDAVVVVSEEEIVNATKLIMERVKVVVEPSGAAGLAAVLSPEFAKLVDGGGGGGGGGDGGDDGGGSSSSSKKKGRGAGTAGAAASTATSSRKVERVGVILSGGNIDLEPLFEAMLKGNNNKRRK